MPQPDTTVGDDRFDRLYRNEYEPMVALAYLLVGVQQAAEDVVQDAFAAISARFDEVENPVAYLRTSVVNGTRRWHRRLRREERWQAVHEPVVADAATADAVAVRRVLGELSPDQREAIVLRYFADLSLREVGEVLGIPTQTAATRVRRGLERVRTMLEDR